MNNQNIRNILNRIDLQLFASPVTDAVTDTATMPEEIQSFYDTELLDNAKSEMIYAQFAKRQTLPARHGKTVEWRKWNTFERADQLQEGVIPSGQKFGVSVKQAAIEQYGTYATLSDQLELHAYDDVILGATEEMGASAAQTQEILIRDALLTNTNVLYCDNINLNDGSVASTPTTPAEMQASETVLSALTPDMIAKAVTKMKKDRVPTINGKYVAVVHPSCAYDLRRSRDWLEAHQYAAPDQLFNGEIGELHGCRFVENVFAPVLGGDDYTNAAGGVTYATYLFGKDAFGIVDPEGGALRMIVKDRSQVGGPLDQFSTVGYKLETNGATVLYPERILRLMSCSSYSDSDEVN